MFDMLAKRAPVIVLWTLCAALLGAWFSVPVWLSNGLAITVGCLALLLLVARGRRRPFESPQESDVDGIRERIAYELAGKGTPGGFYLLGFFGILTIMMTGLQTPYGALAFAGLALAVVWGIVNAHYPSDPESEP